MTTRRGFLVASLASAGVLTLGCRSLRVVAAPRFTSDPFTLGVASGCPTPTSVVLWTRLTPSPLQPDGGMTPAAVRVHWEIASDESMTRIVRRGTARATREWAHSVHVEPQGLEPARDYWYRFTVGDARSPIGRTRTAPAPGSPLARLKVAVASCQQYEHGYFNAYRHMIADASDLIVHTGDYIYELTWGENHVRSHGAPECMTLDDYRVRYALYKSDPDLAAAHAASPWLVIWDDHEVENDYAGAISEENADPKVFLARRAAAYRAYYEHMPLPRWAVPSGPAMRLYTRSAFGDLATFFMLDQRQYRSREACPRPGRAGSNRVGSECTELFDPSRTMLGSQQETWLAKGLGATRTRWNLLTQGTVMAHINEDPGPARRYWTDGWNGYPAARERLMNTLVERRPENPIVLSGDIHAFLVSGLHREPANLDSPVIASELVTTSVSSQGTSQRALNSWSAWNPNLLLANGEHRGYLRLDMTRERLQADLVSVTSEKVPQSESYIFRSFVIEAGRAGPVAA